MTRLYIEDDEGNVQVVPLESGEVSLGRSSENDIVLDEKNVSRKHAIIRRSDDQFVLVDSGARFGLRINGAVVGSERPVRPGDIIELGDYKIKVMAPDSAVADDPTEEVGAVEPDRRETVQEPPVVEKQAPSEMPTRLTPLEEMEEVASSQDWEADSGFDEIDEVPGMKRSNGTVLTTVVLVLVAVVLGMVYFWASSETDVPFAERPESPPVVVVTPPPEKPAPAPAPEPVPVVEPEPAAEPTPAAESEPAPEPVVVVEPKPTPAPVVVDKPKPRPRPKPAPVPRKVARIEKKAPKPKPMPAKPPAAENAYAGIDSALKDFSAADAHRLLGSCKGSGCVKRWKKLAKMYEGFGEPKNAIAVYKRLIRMTRDPTSKERFKKKITALGGTVD